MEETCVNCLHYKGEYHETYTRMPNRHGIKCQKHGIQIRQIGGESTTTHTCINYEPRAHSIPC
jgi:hypothetical protein